MHASDFVTVLADHSFAPVQTRPVNISFEMKFSDHFTFWFRERVTGVYKLGIPLTSSAKTLIRNMRQKI